MFVVAGATGHVGAAVAQQLLAKRASVTVLMRNEHKGVPWARQGATVAVVDLHDQRGLTEVLRGSHGVFLLLPTNFAVADFRADQREMADAMAGAVKDGGVPHAVMLSSIGADLAEGTGPILGLHYLENRLRETGAIVSAIRCGHFQENVETMLDAARGSGVYPVFGESADVAFARVAARDIGAVVAETLLSPPASSQIVDLTGPLYSEREIAEKLGAALGKTLQVVAIPPPGWVDAMVETGLSRPSAEILAEMVDADHRGLLQPKGDRHIRAGTEIDETIRRII